MSNHLAIAAVTETLRALLNRAFAQDPHVPGTTITTVPPAQAPPGNIGGHRLNLFLYSVAPNGGWRNEPMPATVKPGESGFPPLALNLGYLLTPFESGEDGHLGHILLGKGMRVLHDNPVLDPADIKAALDGNDLYAQIERVRVVPMQLSVDDITKLWTTFQTPYRVSGVYQATVVLIEGLRSAKTPLPVLARGEDDRGPTAQAGLESGCAHLDSIEMPTRLQFAARLGEAITIRGGNLGGTKLVVKVRHPLLDEARELPAKAGRDDQHFALELPAESEAAEWPAGFYHLAAVIEVDGEHAQQTNELSFALAPRFTISPAHAHRDENGHVRFEVTVRPPVYPEQSARLLLGDRQVSPESIDPPPETPAPTDKLSFVVPRVAPGRYFARLRVDGVDSLLVKPGIEPPAFDPDLQVTIG